MGAQWLPAAALLLGSTAAMPNGLGQTPAMAWSSWNYFAFGINETIALEIGDALVSTGLAKLGYRYVNIDAGSFTGDRDKTTGKILPNAKKYPRGMRWLSDQLHAKGLMFGVYTDISLHTCGGSGSMGHYKLDAETYAHDWQVDYLKVDFCGATPGPTNLSTGHVSYQPRPQYDAWMALGKELNATGRPIYYSICPHRPVLATDGLPAEWVGDVACKIVILSPICVLSVSLIQKVSLFQTARPRSGARPSATHSPTPYWSSTRIPSTAGTAPTLARARTCTAGSSRTLTRWSSSPTSPTRGLGAGTMPTCCSSAPTARGARLTPLAA